MQMCMATTNTAAGAGSLAYTRTRVFTRTRAWIMESREKCVPCKTCVPIQINVYLTDSERATNEEALGFHS